MFFDALQKILLGRRVECAHISMSVTGHVSLVAETGPRGASPATPAYFQAPAYVKSANHPIG